MAKKRSSKKTKKYKCELCDKSFSTKRGLEQHIKKSHKKVIRVSKKTAYIATSLVVLGLVAFLLFLATSGKQEPSITITPTPENQTVVEPTVTGEASLKMVVLNDRRCEECNIEPILESLKKLFPNVNIEEVDYNSEQGKELYNSTGVKYLPAVLFEESVKDDRNFIQIQRYVKQAGDYLSLNIGSRFDPTAELCENGVDDDEDGKVDCDDEDCSSQYFCTKRAVPEVELFVMSYCPFGTQTEKGILPVLSLLGDKIDFKLRFVSYAMHGAKEVNENLLQYCIQKEEPDKFLDYLECFLEAGNSTGCFVKANIDQTKIDACKASTDQEFKISENLNNRDLWLGGRFPRFDIDKDLNDKYGIRGSPGLAINGVKVDRFRRDPAGLLATICRGFAVQPEECTQELSSTTPSPGFGFSSGSTGATGGQCG
ncbi:hypothetical protein DRJ48_03200 [Candidatus Woesearchaeota archaeon]|nr:hypothetical protein [Candidatus Woesearchaeota archaeon]RLE42603.1 MAG: hypothetical protein DRJ48_03200 [Candidatus Woesearchaeota archaeon]